MPFAPKRGGAYSGGPKPSQAPHIKKQRGADGSVVYRAKPASKGYRKRAQRSKTTPAKKVSRAQAVLYMSPFGKTAPPMSGQSAGNFLCVLDTLRDVFTQPAGADQKTILAFIPSIRGPYTVLGWNAGSATSNNNILLLNDFSPLDKYRTSDTPTVTRPLRAGAKVQCLAPAQTREGSITVLNSSSPLVLDWVTPLLANNISAGNALGIWNAINSNPKSRVYTAEDLAHGQNEFVCYKATNAAYHDYGAPFQTANSPVTLQTGTTNAESDMPMSTILMAFSAVTTAQSYALEFCIQSAMRHPANTLLGSLAKPGGPPGSPEFVRDVDMHTTENGSVIAPSPHFAGAGGNA